MRGDLWHCSQAQSTKWGTVVLGPLWGCLWWVLEKSYFILWVCSTLWRPKSSSSVKWGYWYVPPRSSGFRVVFPLAPALHLSESCSLQAEVRDLNKALPRNWEVGRKAFLSLAPKNNFPPKLWGGFMLLDRPGGDFVSQGTLSNVWRHWGHYSRGDNCYWHLVSGGQGCCYTAHDAQCSC